AFAVFRLMTSAYFTRACTGRSAGFRPALCHRQGAPLSSASQVPPLACPLEFGECQHTDWIGLCWAILGQPVGTRGWQWAASGGTIPLSTAKSASTRSIHVSYWDRWCGTA